MESPPESRSESPALRYIGSRARTTFLRNATGVIFFHARKRRLKFVQDSQLLEATRNPQPASAIWTMEMRELVYGRACIRHAHSYRSERASGVRRNGSQLRLETNTPRGASDNPKNEYGNKSTSPRSDAVWRGHKPDFLKSASSARESSRLPRCLRGATQIHRQTFRREAVILNQSVILIHA